MIPFLNRRTRLLQQSFANAIRSFFEQDESWPVFFRWVPDDQAPPWVVFLLDGSRDGDIWKYDVTLEISGYIGQEELVDDAMDALLDYLHAYAHTDERQSWQCFVETAGEIPSTDPNLTRRRATLELRLMEV